MDQHQQGLPEQGDDPQKESEAVPATSGIQPDGTFTFPPKPELEQKKKRNVWLRSLTSLGLYLLLGYVLFNGQIIFLLILTAVVIIHELGHFVAMKLYDYRELGIFFIPLIGAYASGTKQETSQKQSSVILLAGPMPGILAGMILYLVLEGKGIADMNDVYLQGIASIFIYLNLLNLIPVYPLDGGQLLNRLFLDEHHIISRVFVFLSSALMVWLAIRIHFYALLVFPAMILYRLYTDIVNDRLVARIEAEGVDLTKSYEEITDEEYWKIRNAVIRHHPDLAHIPPAPPYTYADREDKVIVTLQSLLQRSIILDLPLAGKMLIIILWIACFVAPFWLGIEFPFFRRF